MAALQLGGAGGGVGGAGRDVAVAASHCRRVGGGVEAWRPGQRSQVGAAGGLCSQVGRRTWSCQKIRCVSCVCFLLKCFFVQFLLLEVESHELK